MKPNEIAQNIIDIIDKENIISKKTSELMRYALESVVAKGSGRKAYMEGYRVGGKTGTTDMSGHCLMILAKDTAGNPYIGVILRASSRDLINKEMVQMLSEINK